jgi:hypothetical protein
MRGLTRLAVVIAAASIPIVGLVAPVSAKKVHGHPGAGTPQILIRVSPNPLVETSTSNVAAIISVEANPSFAGNTVTISSTQLVANCKGGNGLPAPGPTVDFFTDVSPYVGGSITITLDNDGNATVVVVGTNCSPGTDLFEASLNAPPFATAVTKLVVQPPQVTPPGVHAFPNPEVEVGDQVPPFRAGPPFFDGPSEADFVFYVETNPVFAEQTVTIESNELTARCGLGPNFWFASNGVSLIGTGGGFPGGTTGQVATQTAGIDNDGNAVFVFTGDSCAAGKSTVIAEVFGNGPTYSTQVNILPPAVTI